MRSGEQAEDSQLFIFHCQSRTRRVKHRWAKTSSWVYSILELSVLVQEKKDLVQELMSMAREEILLGKKIIERLHCVELVVTNIEDGVKLRDMQDVPDFLTQAEQFQLASGVAYGSEGRD